MSVVSQAEQTEVLTLGQTGLSVDRWLDPVVAAPLQEDLYLTFPGLVKVRSRIGVNLLDFDDVRHQSPLHDVSADAAQQAVEGRVGSLTDVASVKFTHTQIPDTPWKHRTAILARITQVEGTPFATEREDSINTLQSLADIKEKEFYDWRHKSIALVIGNILSDATDVQRLNVKKLVAHYLQGFLGLEPAFVQPGNPDRRIPKAHS